MNEEQNLPNEKVEEKIETNEASAKKKLPLGAIIGIAVGAVAVIVAVVLIILLSGNNDEECTGHIDADDNHLCDKCGIEYEDGDAAVDTRITFKVLLDDGTPLSGVVFTLTRGSNSYTLTTGQDGTVKADVPPQTYALTYDDTTLPDFCWIDVPGIKIENGATEIAITVINNTPDGSLRKPFPASEESMNITVAPGEEIYYSCRSTSLRYVTLNSENLIVNYNGETYTATDGVITVGVSSVDVETPTIFSVKNISDSTVTAVMEVYAPLGSYDNPIKLTENSATAQVPAEGTVYYSYKTEKDGIFVITSPTVGNQILVTRNITKVVDGVEQIVSTITAEKSDNSAGYIYVAEGDEIRINVSFVAPADSDGDNAEGQAEENEEPEVNNVDFSFYLYAATDSEPAPILNSDIYIRLDAGASVVFSGEIGQTLAVESESEINISYNGTDISSGADIIIGEEAKFTITNSTDKLAIFTVIIK